MLQNLIICGGGINIISYIGVITVLHERDLLKNVKTFYGTSAGGIISVMLALGYTVNEIKQFMFKFDFHRIISDIDPSLLFDEKGLSNGRNMEIITKSVISFKLGEDKMDYTLRQLYEDTGISITLSTYNLTQKKNTYFDNTSDVPIWKALIATCRIPFIFAPFEIDGDMYIDGAICDNFPIHLVPESEVCRSLAIYINGSKEVVSSGYPMIDYVYDLMGVYISGNINNFLTKYQPIIVTIPSTTAFFNFELTEAQKQEMYDLGYGITSTRLPEIEQYWLNGSTPTKCDKCVQTDDCLVRLT